MALPSGGIGIRDTMKVTSNGARFTTLVTFLKGFKDLSAIDWSYPLHGTKCKNVHQELAQHR